MVWLLDPVHTQLNVTPPADGIAEPWNGEFYVSFGHSTTRSWVEAVQYGFICGGGGAWYPGFDYKDFPSFVKHYLAGVIHANDLPTANVSCQALPKLG